MKEEHVGSAAKQLGYAKAPDYFDAERFHELPPNELRFGCRKARRTCGLRGVYLLRDPEGRNHIPAVFLCEAETEQEARAVHRRVWNQNLVPFVVIETPTRIRVYPGFSYDADPGKDLSFVEASVTDVAQVLAQLAAFRAEAIDEGRIFKDWGDKVTPKSRVDEHLLGQLEQLDARLRDLGLARGPSHSLIGKYVWLSYLKDRDILSDWRLGKAGVRADEVFGRQAKLNAFQKLDEYLQGWLNGEIFPLQGEGLRAVKAEHLRKVAGVFAGDDPDGQMGLFPKLYDFSHVPIETLSVVYEQFLHQKDEGEESSEGEESGAYYTPICLADFMIEEMDRKLGLQDGVAVLDPACGSGAFLVQVYRRLVERTMQQRRRRLKLTELRALLVDNIFGVDRDPDACHVARMSLAIALLDYADPPDVSGPNSNFRLPPLSENNILRKDFFELDPVWPRAKDGQPPLWIIGNPPWVELKASKRTEDVRNRVVWEWFDANSGLTLSWDRFKEPASLGSKLRRQSDPVSAYLYSRLCQETRLTLHKYEDDPNGTQALQFCLAADLNRAIKGPLLFGASRFAGVALRPRTQRLLQQNPKEEDLIRLNRQLLEDAYPQEIAREHKARPVSGNQVAEAFVWRALDFARSDTVVSLVLPGMTLCKHEGQGFRQAVFSELDVWRVVNFANFAYVLFSGADRPACCLFYKPGNAPSEAGAKPIVALAPLVADQGANRPNKAGGRLGTWNILVRESDWREIDRDEARRGDRLTWKLAMWGGVREAGLIRRLGRFPRFADWSKDAGFTVAAGPELRKGPGEGLTLIRQLIGQRVVSFRSTKGEEAFFRIPRSCLSDPLQQERCYLRDRGGLKGLAVCEPPHLVVNKGRRFAVFSKDFLVVPPGENGIQGENVALLKALALYLISPPARWHQFFISSEWGVSTSVARLDDLQALPIPLSHEGSAPTEELAALYDQLAEDEEQGCPDKDALLVRAEAIVWRLCNLRAQERELIEGFFSGPYQCIKGKCPDDAIQPAMRSDVQGYCRILRRELDDYLEQQGVRHQIVASVHENEVCLTIEGRRTSTAIEPVVQGVSDRQAEAITSIDRWLRQKHSQRAYFEKSLFFYDHDHGRVMFLKPRRRIEWNVRQALLDADDVIAELLSGRD